MSPLAAKRTHISIDDYLVGERDAETRHEYVDGEVYVMTDASRSHALIATAMAGMLLPLARKRRGQLFTNDMKLRLELAGSTIFYYPDLMLACDPQDDNPYYLSRPCLIVEVLSPGSERIDRREKLLSYTSLPSVQEALLVAQDQAQIEIHRRAQDWKGELFEQGNIRLDSLDAELDVAQVYADVDWTQG